jgi:ureidoglycolate lyase
MKIVRFARDSAVPELGISNGAAIASLSHLLPDNPGDMISLIERWETLKPEIAKITAYDLPLDAVHLLAPVANPRKILGIGLNYADHVAEAGIDIPADQIWFSKPPTAVCGPFDPIERPVVSQALDYEAELVFIIGTRCRHIRREDAGSVIFGYAAGNDVSVRDWQLRTSQFMLGKSFDTHAPFGPCIVTADAIDADNLVISASVNGELRQRSNTSHLIFDPAAQIEHLSKVMTLEPGDVIFTGTPGGSGGLMTPPQWLRPGDKVRVEIEHIGYIENEVIDELPPR